jgi:hypothetical protein
MTGIIPGHFIDRPLKRGSLPKTIFALAIAMAVLVLAGCSSISVSDNGNKVKISSPELQTDISLGKAALSEIGVPLYPGAQFDEQSSATLEEQSGSGTKFMGEVDSWTNDPVSQVVAWYKTQLSGKQGFTDLSSTVSKKGEESGLFTFNEGEGTCTVSVAKDVYEHPGRTTIAATRATDLK